MKKIYKNLTKDQIERGVVFSSQLIGFKGEENGVVHEVLATDRLTNIDLLKKDSFFDGIYEYNLIRTNRNRDE